MNTTSTRYRVYVWDGGILNGNVVKQVRFTAKDDDSAIARAATHEQPNATIELVKYDPRFGDYRRVKVYAVA